MQNICIVWMVHVMFHDFNLFHWNNVLSKKMSAWNVLAKIQDDTRSDPSSLSP